LRHAGEIVAHFFHELHAEFLVCHFPTAKLQLHAHFVAAIEELFAMANFCQIIVVVDIHPELEFLQLRPGWFLILIVFGNVVTKFSQRDDLTNRRIRSRGDFDQIEAAVLRFTQGVGQAHDAELLTTGPDNDPHFAGANPTVYTKLRLQIESIS